MQLEQLAPVTDSGTRPNARSESKSFGADVPRNAIITSFALSSRNRVAWVSVSSSLNVLRIVDPNGGFAQLSSYEAAAKVVYRVILLKMSDDTTLSQQCSVIKTQNIIIALTGLLCNCKQWKETTH